MAIFKVTGNTPLHGSVRIGGAKNASFKLMIAAMLSNEESRLLNFSHISDVDLVAKIINYLGGTAQHIGERALAISGNNTQAYTIAAEHGEQGRFSTMFIPVLLHKFGKAVVPAPGGDKIGKRPLDRHFDGLEALGATIRTENGMYIAEAQELRGTTYRFKKNSHTGTETVLMAAVMAKGTTILENAAIEPEIDDLILFLNNMGAHIKRIEPRTIKIEGVSTLHGAIHRIIPDRNEAVSYACAALATKGDVIIENARSEHLTAFLHTLDRMNAGYEIGSYGIRFYYKGPLEAVDIVTKPEPGFMTDWQPLMATLLTQCNGTSTIHETVMAQRFQYVQDLQAMGANIEFFNPIVSDLQTEYNFNIEDDIKENAHAIRILGPTPLHSIKVSVRDLRHGATLILAALTAEGTSTIESIEQVDRGYESLDTRLRSMGAHIIREENTI